jgi:hypothetical protein
MKRFLISAFVVIMGVFFFEGAAMASVPAGNYRLYNSDLSWSVSIITNPSNYGVRAIMRCVAPQGYVDHYGSWVYSVGAISNVNSNCDGGGTGNDHGLFYRGYFEWKKSDPTWVLCMKLCDPRIGSC